MKRALIVALLLALATPDAAEQAQDYSDPALAWFNCLKRVFPRGDTNAAAIEQAFNACAAEEVDFHIALTAMLLIPPDLPGANTLDDAGLEAERVIFALKQRMGWYKLKQERR
jgi:hypothetical protein